jgi:uncharacterized protein with HEPN domain
MKTISTTSPEFKQAITKRSAVYSQIEVLNDRIDVLENSYRTAEERVELKSLENARALLAKKYTPLNNFILWVIENVTVEVSEDQLNAIGIEVVEQKVVSEKSKLFSTAWELVKITSKSFSVCLAKAWNLFRLRKKLQTNDKVKFSFEKVDGTLRVANGTLKNVSDLVKGTGKEVLSTMNYFDVDAGQFRSFRIENLISIY